jgi:hypothetical protein
MKERIAHQRDRIAHQQDIKSFLDQFYNLPTMRSVDRDFPLFTSGALLVATACQYMVCVYVVVWIYILRIFICYAITMVDYSAALACLPQSRERIYLLRPAGGARIALRSALGGIRIVVITLFTCVLCSVGLQYLFDLTQTFDGEGPARFQSNDVPVDPVTRPCHCPICQGALVNRATFYRHKAAVAAADASPASVDAAVVGQSRGRRARVDYAVLAGQRVMHFFFVSFFFEQEKKRRKKIH